MFLHQIHQANAARHTTWLWLGTFERSLTTVIFFPLNTSTIHFPCCFILWPPHWVCCEVKSQGLGAFGGREIESERTAEWVPHLDQILYFFVGTVLNFIETLIITRDKSHSFDLTWPKANLNIKDSLGKTWNFCFFLLFSLKALLPS